MLAKDEDCERFGRRVRRLREQLGFSQEELADRVGIHRTYVGGIERGERNPTLGTIYRIARGLKIEPSRLLG
jgi:transcriptional regulator with XRE-family HTH domain